MPGRLSGKCAVIVGGGQTPGETIGNGRATAVLFAREGARVLVFDRDLASAEDTVSMITDEGNEAHAHRADVTSEADCEAIVAVAVERLGGIDILQNNVGIVAGDGHTTSLPLETWRRIMDTNLTGMWLTCKYVIPAMVERGGGAVTNVSSMAGLSLAPESIAYSLSKHGVNGLTRALALENAPHGVRVNCVLPGLMDTPLGVDDAVRRRNVPRADIAATRAAVVPMGRQGTAWDVAHASLFLASDEAAFITGALLPVDGGHTLMVGMVPASAH